MDEQTINKLNHLNRDFYLKVGEDFSKTRQHPWKGWHQLIPIINGQFLGQFNLKVLDVGCGNGRFGSFLATQLNNTIEYVGWDNNQLLLEEAEEILAENNKIHSLQLIKVDLLESLPEARVDIVCLFGVLHHIPSFQARAVLLNQLADRLNPAGLLIFTAWQFDQLQNIYQRRVDPSKVGLLEGDLEPNDFFLNWEKGTQAIRYCHLILDSEINDLVLGTELHLIDDFAADGPNETANTYIVLQK